jgi:hypothetical protein
LHCIGFQFFTVSAFTCNIFESKYGNTEQINIYIYASIKLENVLRKERFEIRNHKKDFVSSFWARLNNKLLIERKVTKTIYGYTRK